jgi:hypothetical protein
MCESGIFVRGYMQIYQDTRVDQIITSITRDQNTKYAFFFLGSGSIQGTGKQNRAVGGFWCINRQWSRGLGVPVRHGTKRE